MGDRKTDRRDRHRQTDKQNIQRNKQTVVDRRTDMLMNSGSQIINKR